MGITYTTKCECQHFPRTFLFLINLSYSKFSGHIASSYLSDQDYPIPNNCGVIRNIYGHVFNFGFLIPNTSKVFMISNSRGVFHVPLMCTNLAFSSKRFSSLATSLSAIHCHLSLESCMISCSAVVLGKRKLQNCNQRRCCNEE